MRSGRVTAVAVIALAGAYGWWLAGLRPFTLTAYLAIAFPTVLLATALALPRTGGSPTGGDSDHRSPTPSGRQFFPIATALVFGLGLEMAGLALGGRSPFVPTLSTVLDHALRWHLVRFLMILAWLAVGLRLARRGRRPVSADGA